MKNILIPVWVVLLVGIGQVAFGTTWYVAPAPLGDSKNPGTEERPFSYIQSGINAASDGDTVLVARGTYIQNLNFKGKSIVVHSTDPLDPDVVANTIIDGNGTGSCVTFSGDEDETCILSGFTIRNGEAETGGGICGSDIAWSGDHTYATITDNIITGNTGIGGAGLALCDGLIENNVITGNTSPEIGGGLMACHGTIRNNTISANSAQSAGGGLRDCDGTIEYNVISDNSSIGGSGLFGCGGTIQNNVISGNSSRQDGGGLYLCHGIIQNNLIIGNQATSGDQGRGGGIAWCNGTFRNNLIIGNSARHGGGAYSSDAGSFENNTIVDNVAIVRGGGLNQCSGTIYNCILWGNSAPTGTQIYNSSSPTYSCIQGGADGEGNITESPMFVDADGPDNDPDTYEDNNYRLSERSPCIDVGMNEDWMSGAVDLDGNPRLWRGASSLKVDMGAYEFDSFPFKVRGIGKGTGGGAELTWNSRPVDTYRIWSSPDPSDGESWIQEQSILSGGDITTWNDPDTTSPCKFYRIETD